MILLPHKIDTCTQRTRLLGLQENDFQIDVYIVNPRNVF